MVRKRVLLPLVVLYMLALAGAAWPPEIQPAALNQTSAGLQTMLASVGIKAGMAVFPGTLEKQNRLVRFRCIVVKGTDSSGAESRIYPTDAWGLEPNPG